MYLTSDEWMYKAFIMQDECSLLDFIENIRQVYLSRVLLWFKRTARDATLNQKPNPLHLLVSIVKIVKLGDNPNIIIIETSDHSEALKPSYLLTIKTFVL